MKYRIINRESFANLDVIWVDWNSSETSGDELDNFVRFDRFTIHRTTSFPSTRGQPITDLRLPGEGRDFVPGTEIFYLGMRSVDTAW